MSARKITLRIGSVTIDGGALSKRALRAAIERELREQLSQPGALDAFAAGRAVERLSATAGPAGDAGTLGTGIARAAMGAIRR